MVIGLSDLPSCMRIVCLIRNLIIEKDVSPLTNSAPVYNDLNERDIAEMKRKDGNPNICSYMKDKVHFEAINMDDNKILRSCEIKISYTLQPRASHAGVNARLWILDRGSKF